MHKINRMGAFGGIGLSNEDGLTPLKRLVTFGNMDKRQLFRLLTDERVWWDVT